nr:zinc ABC transporter substrate-binding protein [Archaeoglobus neptunius]
MIHPAGASTIVVTVSDFKPIVEAVAGDGFEVVSLLPPGSDPHGFSLSIEDVEMLKNADLIVLANSRFFDFEAKISKEFTNTLDFDDYNVKLYDFPGFRKNPHGYWMLPENAIGIARAVKKRLSELYPDKKMLFDENYRIFVSRVEEAKREARKIAESERGKMYVAMVPGVCYIARALDINIAAVLMSEGSAAASAREITDLRAGFRSGKYAGIIVPEFMKGGKGEELAEELVDGTNAKIVWVKFSQGDAAYDTVLISNAARIAYTQNCGECGENSFWIYILAVLCVFEALLVAVVRLRV